MHLYTDSQRGSEVHALSRSTIELVNVYFRASCCGVEGILSQIILPLGRCYCMEALKADAGYLELASDLSETSLR